MTKQPIKKKEQEYLNNWKRTQADFENYKKEEGQRIEREKEIVVKKDREIFAIDLLKIQDNLERLDRALGEYEKASDQRKQEILPSILEGMKYINIQINEMTEMGGLEEIKSMDCVFNPSLHEAVEEVDSDKESGMIVEVIQKGYLSNGQVLRPSKVRVAK